MGLDIRGKSHRCGPTPKETFGTRHPFLVPLTARLRLSGSSSSSFLSRLPLDCMRGYNIVVVVGVIRSIMVEVVLLWLCSHSTTDRKLCLKCRKPCLKCMQRAPKPSVSYSCILTLAVLGGLIWKDWQFLSVDRGFLGTARLSTLPC